MLVFGESRSIWTLIQAYVAWQLVNSWLLWMIEQSNRRALDGRESFNRFPGEGEASGWMQIVGTVLTQWMYPFTAWRAYKMDQVGWRGVSYKLGADGTVELIESTDATANLRGGSDKSPELLTAGSASEAVEDKDDATEATLPSHFSKRSRN